MSQLLLKKAVTGIVFAVSFSSATQVSAASYLFEVDNPSGSDYAGNITSFSTIYDDSTQQLSFSSTIEKNDYGHLANGFWLVLSDGPNPKNNYNEYAIFYGDSITGNLTTYLYNGINSSNSWDWPGEFIKSFADGLDVDWSTDDEVTFSFSIDASVINDYTPMAATPYGNDWDGASFGEEIGIWFHPAVFEGTGPTYNDDGSLASFPIKKSGWYDTAGQPTEVIAEASVPAPTTTLLLSAGLLGFVGSKRRKA